MERRERVEANFDVFDCEGPRVCVKSRIEKVK